MHVGDKRVLILQALPLKFESFGGAKNRRRAIDLSVFSEFFEKFQTGADGHLMIGDKEIDSSLAESIVSRLSVADRFNG